MPKNIKPYYQTYKSFHQLIIKVASENYNGSLLTRGKARIFFIVKAYKNKKHIDFFAKRLSQLSNSASLELRSEMLGAVDWPYIHNRWDIPTKLDKIATHYEVLSEIPSDLIYITGNATGDGLDCHELMDLSDISQNLKIVIDKAPWFAREGELLINILMQDLRVASIAFTLGKVKGEKVAYIGAIQGIYGGFPVNQALEIYKTLTKEFQGLRPRSLLLEILKVLMKKLGVSSLYCISDNNRHHRHKYFGKDKNTAFKNDYNAMWEEHDGILNMSTGFYEISTNPSIKDMADIPSKKRSLYKRRYEIIFSLDNRLKLENLN